MPCNSDYLEPSQRENLLRNTAMLLVYALVELGFTADPALRAAADDMYCADDRVSDLCGLLRSLGEEERDRLVYGRPQHALCRRLADWWEEHCKADSAREADDAQKG